MTQGVKYLVFSYGTLKRGFPNHYLLTEGKFNVGDGELHEERESGHMKYMGRARLSEQYPLVVGGLFRTPYLLDAPGKGLNVYGEVYEVDEDMLNLLDRLEGYPHYYHRLEIDMHLLGEADVAEQDVRGFAYFLKDFHDHLLKEEHIEEYLENHLRDYIPRSERRERANYMKDLLHSVKVPAAAEQSYILYERNQQQRKL
eukprot:Clim_evm85s134 gene=Clim_evmTU85s134